MANGHVVYIDRVESHWPLGLRFESGSRVPLHCTAIGKLLLSRLPGTAINAHLASGSLTRYTSTTITEPRRRLFGRIVAACSRRAGPGRALRHHSRRGD
jgi:DNA-binding IclR family transcriptional regulator